MSAAHLHDLAGRVVPVYPDHVEEVRPADHSLWPESANAVIVLESGQQHAVKETVEEAERLLEAAK